MQTLLVAVLLFLDLIFYFIIIDVILSWLLLFGLKLRPKFISDIINPIYVFIRNIIPTNIGFFDFTPIIIIFVIAFMKGVIFNIFPDVVIVYKNLINF